MIFDKKQDPTPQYRKDLKALGYEINPDKDLFMQELEAIKHIFSMKIAVWGSFLLNFIEQNDKSAGQLVNIEIFPDRNGCWYFYYQDIDIKGKADMKELLGVISKARCEKRKITRQELYDCNIWEETLY